MRRGTTPTLKLTLDVDPTTFDTLFILFKQGETLITKSGEDLTLNSEEKSIVVKLTQEETLKLNCSKGNVRVQLRAKLNDEAYATSIVHVQLKDILEDRAI